MSALGMLDLFEPLAAGQIIVSLVDDELMGKSARLTVIVLVPDDRHSWLQFLIIARTAGVNREDFDPLI